ncbi:MAG: deoxyhypusine synthase [Methanomicrobium sp.]|nr:deoxyhypusine synthase [Methanomicrobium sp.]
MKRVKAVRPDERVDELLSGMAETGFQGRKLGESLEVLTQMIADDDCTVILGLSGAMIPAGMQRVVIELVKRRYIDVMVSTGANIFHDACEHLDVHHYKGHHNVDDAELLAKGIDRIYDVFAREDEFRKVDAVIADFGTALSRGADGGDGNRGYNISSAEFTYRLGKHLMKLNPEGESILSESVKNGVKIFIPALCDSSIGIALVSARRAGADISIDQLADADILTRIVENSERTGVVYVGGGVPKNFIQQTQVIASIHDAGKEGHNYAVQFTVDSPQWGGLSGCTFEEAVSWGKEATDCRKVQCFCDATIAFPIVVSGLIARGVVRKSPPDIDRLMK